MIPVNTAFSSVVVSKSRVGCAFLVSNVAKAEAGGSFESGVAIKSVSPLAIVFSSFHYIVCQ